MGSEEKASLYAEMTRNNSLLSNEDVPDHSIPLINWFFSEIDFSTKLS